MEKTGKSNSDEYIVKIIKKSEDYMTIKLIVVDIRSHDLVVLMIYEKKNMSKEQIGIQLLNQPIDVHETVNVSAFFAMRSISLMRFLSISI